MRGTDTKQATTLSLVRSERLFCEQLDYNPARTRSPATSRHQTTRGIPPSISKARSEATRRTNRRPIPRRGWRREWKGGKAVVLAARAHGESKRAARRDPDRVGDRHRRARHRHRYGGPNICPVPSVTPHVARNEGPRRSSAVVDKYGAGTARREPPQGGHRSGCGLIHCRCGSIVCIPMVKPNREPAGSIASPPPRQGAP